MIYWGKNGRPAHCFRGIPYLGRGIMCVRYVCQLQCCIILHYISSHCSACTTIFCQVRHDQVKWLMPSTVVLLFTSHFFSWTTHSIKVGWKFCHHSVLLAEKLKKFFETLLKDFSLVLFDQTWSELQLGICSNAQ